MPGVRVSQAERRQIQCKGTGGFNPLRGPSAACHGRTQSAIPVAANQGGRAADSM